MKINYKEVEKLETFNGVKLRGDETFDELLQIERNNMLKGTVICKSKNCSKYLYKNQSPNKPEYCMDCF